MISQGIKISWDYSEEYIEIDFNSVQEITSTIEWWPREEQWVKYNVVSKIEKTNDNLYVLSIMYDPAINTHLSKDEICWGESIINLDISAKSGKATWSDANYPSQSGQSKWTRINTKLIKNKTIKETVSRIARRQEHFRKALLALDECCVITGTKTPAALEAAHIIPACRGGAEVVENGILLRSDIHRLYDAGLFTICDNGKIEPHTTITGEYDELKNAQISSGAFMRIQRALRKLSQL